MSERLKDKIAVGNPPLYIGFDGLLSAIGTDLVLGVMFAVHLTVGDVGYVFGQLFCGIVMTFENQGPIVQHR